MRFVAKAALVAGFLLFAFGCGQAPEDASDGNRFRYAVGDPIASLDPAHATPPTARMLSGAIYDTLYRYQYLARPYALTTGLAQGFPEVSEDGLSYTIRIRPNVLFHAHEQLPAMEREVTANDVIYSMLRHFDPAIEGQAAWLWNEYIVGVSQWRAAGANYDQPPAGLQVTERYTLQIKLSRPFGDFLQTLALPVAAIVSRTAIEHFGEDYPLNPVGTGPYQLQRFTTGSVLLAANPDYQLADIRLSDMGYETRQHQAYGLEQLSGMQLPLSDTIEVRFIHDVEERWQALLDGRVDGMQLPAMLYDEALQDSSDDLLQVKLKPALQALLYINHQPLALLYKIDFNMADIRLGEIYPEAQHNYNHDLRCKLQQAFDWQGYNQQFFDQLGYVYAGVIPPLVSDTQSANAEPEQESGQEPASNDNLFADFGHLPIIEFGYSESRLNERIFEYFQDSISAAGYPRELLQAKSYSGFSAFATAYSNKELPLVHTAWALDYPSPLNTLQLYISDNASPGPGLANYSNAEFDDWYRQAHSSIDGPKRQQLITKMQQRLVDQCISIAGFSPGQIHVWRKAFVAYPDGDFASGELLRYVMPVKHDQPNSPDSPL